MFQKRIIELFTFVAYWLVFVPYAHNYAKQQKWVILELDKLSEVISRYSFFLVAMIIGYMVSYRVILWSYMKCKLGDKKMFNNLQKIRLDPENSLSREALSPSKSVNKLDNVYHSLSTMDEVDTVKSKKSKQRSQDQEMQPIGSIRSPIMRQKFLSRTNNAYVVDTLPAIHSMTKPVNTHTTEYCIRKPAPPPPLTPKQVRNNPSTNLNPNLERSPASGRFKLIISDYETRRQFVLPPLPGAR